MPYKSFSKALLAGAITLFAVATPAAAATAPFSLGDWKFKLDDGVIFRMSLLSDTVAGASNTVIDIKNFTYAEPHAAAVGFTATLLPTGTDFNPAGPATDNLMFNTSLPLQSTEPHLTAGGFAFSFDEAAQAGPPALVNYQVFLDGSQYKGCYLEPDGTQECVGVTVQAVPEPASWALMITGFGLVGAALRRRSAQQARLVRTD